MSGHQLLKPNWAMTFGILPTAGDAWSWRLGRILKAKEHWTLQTESRKISDLEYDFASLRQFLIFNELHIGWWKRREKSTNNYSSVMCWWEKTMESGKRKFKIRMYGQQQSVWVFERLTPSFVQTHVTQGDMCALLPKSTSFLLIKHLDPLSLQWFKSMSGRLSQGTRGFLINRGEKSVVSHEISNKKKG